ncbi:MAG: aspartate kinase [Clostridiales bacterium]|nr:aspartate kinase [Clostridiales bacterium]
MKDIIVAKFGGTSLADAGRFKRVKSIVQSDGRRRFIVPSAPGKRSKDDFKITDMLYECREKAKLDMPFDDIFDIISKRYTDIINELGLNLDINKNLKDIKNNIKRGASRDYTASRGEYLNAFILSCYLGMDFVDASEVILFDECGNFDADRTNDVLSECLSKKDYAVIPGFYGSMPDGRIKTFTRGGSDVTGAIVARGIDACLYENWTDVSGFLVADPRIVPGARIIENVTYRELRELSYMGATVLHEDAIFPVRKAKIPINIKNTNHPEEKGTIIADECSFGDNAPAITGIAGKKDFTAITIEKTMMNAEIGFGSKLLSIIEKHNVSFEHLPSGIDTVSLVVESSQLRGKTGIIIDEIKKECRPDSISVNPDMALIAIVGRGMANSKTAAAKIFTALAENMISILMIDQGSSGINIIVGVKDGDFERAIRAIYHAFQN